MITKMNCASRFPSLVLLAATLCMLALSAGCQPNM